MRFYRYNIPFCIMHIILLKSTITYVFAFEIDVFGYRLYTCIFCSICDLLFLNKELPRVG